MNNENSQKYGQFYWGVLLNKKEFYLFADEVKFDNGFVSFYGKDKKLNYAFNANDVKQVFSASCLDDYPVCLDHFK